MSFVSPCPRVLGAYVRPRVGLPVSIHRPAPVRPAGVLVTVTPA